MVTASPISLRNPFVDLPSEIHHEIFSYVLPTALTFRFKPRELVEQLSLKKKNRLTRYGVARDVLNDMANLPKEFTPYSNCLLIHPCLTPLVTRQAFSANNFSFPDMAAVDHFVSYLSPTKRGLIRSIQIDACGIATRTQSCKLRVYKFPEGADLDIARIGRIFQGIKKLVLGGIGPGVVREMDILNRRSGLYYKQHVDDLGVWSLDAIQLLAAIVASDEKIESCDDSGYDSNSSIYESENALTGGRIIHAGPQNTYETSLWGYARVRGTVILHRDIQHELGPREEELVDMATALTHAREVDKVQQALKEAARNDPYYQALERRRQEAGIRVHDD